MTTKLTQNEQKLVDYAKRAIVKYNKLRKAKGGIDTLYAFLMSDSGKIYEGACFETNIQHANICAERHAIANMILKESYKAKIKSIVVADPVPEVQKNSTLPCGTCRHVIWEFGAPSTTVICIQYIQRKNDWIFPKMEKHTIKELYPKAYEPVKWD
jgi:cytidine deaminase